MIAVTEVCRYALGIPHNYVWFPPPLSHTHTQKFTSQTSNFPVTKRLYPYPVALISTSQNYDFSVTKFLFPCHKTLISTSLNFYFYVIKLIFLCHTVLISTSLNSYFHVTQLLLLRHKTVNYERSFYLVLMIFIIPHKLERN